MMVTSEQSLRRSLEQNFRAREALREEHARLSRELDELFGRGAIYMSKAMMARYAGTTRDRVYEGMERFNKTKEEAA